MARPQRRRVDRADASLRLGPRVVLLSEVSSFVTAHSVRRDRKSALTTMMIFAVVAFAAMVVVTNFGGRWSLLLTAATFGLVALSAFDDMRRSVTVTIFSLDVVTRSGERVRYATPDLNELQRMVQSLQRSGVVSRVVL